MSRHWRAALRRVLRLPRLLLCAAAVTPAAAQPGFELVDFEPPLPAPAFRLPQLDGGKLALEAFAGRYVLLNFWATWCPPCVKEMPSLQRLAERYPDGALTVLAVSVDEQGRAVVAEFAERLQLDFPILLDPDNEVAGLYGATALPSTFLLDPEGRVIAAAKGERDWSSAAALAYFRDRLGR